jgi:hypothetical protein
MNLRTLVDLYVHRFMHGPCDDPLAHLGNVDLGRSVIFPVSDPLGRTVECLHGVLWLTFDGDRRDIELAANETFVADRAQRMLVQALTPARFRLVGRSAQIPAPRETHQGETA